MNFGDKLKMYRIDNDISQDELAKRLGTSKQVLSRYENNQRTPKITVAQEYAEKLGLPLSYLIDDNQTSYNKIKMSIGDNIKKLREMHNLSQQELAEIAGVTDKAVSTWENNINIPRMGVIQNIADYFNLPKSCIIEDDGLISNDACIKKESFRNRLLEIVTERDLKQEDILRLSKPYCEQYGIRLEKNILSQFLSGKLEPGANELFILAIALNVNEGWLMGFNVSKERKQLPEGFKYLSPKDCMEMSKYHDYSSYPDFIPENGSILIAVLAEKLRIARENAGLTQRQAAVKTGIGCKTINNYENGVSGPDVEKLAALCKAYNVSADYFLNLNDETAPAPSKDQPTDDPYANLSPKVAAELRRLDALGVTGEEPATIVAYNGLNINQTSPKAQAELDRIKKRDYQNAKEFVYEQINDHEKKAAVIGYDNGEKTEIFLDEQETRVILSLIKNLRGE